MVKGAIHCFSMRLNSEKIVAAYQRILGKYWLDARNMK